MNWLNKTSAIVSSACVKDILTMFARSWSSNIKWAMVLCVKCMLLTSCLQRLQEQDKRNHEAYIRSGEIFEDRQQAYEKMTKGYERLLASCQS